jgi:GTPase
LAPFDENVDPVHEAAAIVEELRKYDEDLWAKPRWLVLNKIDMIAEEDRKAKIDDFVKRYQKKTGWKGQVHPISSLTGENTANLMRSVYEDLVQQMLVEFPPEPDARFREGMGTLINPQETGKDQE